MTKALPQTPEDRDRRLVAGPVSTRAIAARAEDEPGRTVIEGYALRFNEETVIGYAPWGFREVIRPGAFTAAVNRDDVRALFNHDPNLILGRNVAKTLMLAEDERGLKYEIDPPKTSYATDLLESIGRGDVTGSSFSFRATKEIWTEPAAGSDDLPLREIVEAELYDVAPCTYPAYDVTSVAVAARAAATAAAEARQRLAEPAPTANEDPAIAEQRARALALAVEAASV